MSASEESIEFRTAEQDADTIVWLSATSEPLANSGSRGRLPTPSAGQTGTTVRLLSGVISSSGLASLTR